MSDIELASPSFSPRAFLSVVLKRKWAILGLYFAMVVACGLYCLFWPPTYEAQTRFLVKNNRQEPTISADPDLIRTLARIPVTEDDLNTEVAVLQSNAVLEETVRQLSLDTLPEHWAIRLINAPFKAITHFYNEYHGKPDATRFQQAVTRLHKKLLIEPQKKSDIIDVRMRWGDPALASRILESLSASYLQHHLEVRKNQEVGDFFLQQAEQKKRELADIEARIQALGAGVTPESLKYERELSLRQTAEFEGDWLKTKAKSQEMQARVRELEQLLSQVPPRVVAEEKQVVNEIALGSLKVQVLDLRRRRTELLHKYTPEQRLVKEVDEELAQAEAMLDRELASPRSETTETPNKLAETLKEHLLLSRAELASLEALQSELKREYDAHVERDTALGNKVLLVQRLERERLTTERSYLNYYKQHEEGRVESEMDRTKFVNVSMIEPVRADAGPVKPDALLLFKIVLSLGTILSLGFGFLLEMLDRRIKSASDAEAAFGIPVLASIDWEKRGGGRNALDF
jgi:uncharacterized protein involved in exopolysaccharide biosynthesis